MISEKEDSDEDQLIDELHSLNFPVVAKILNLLALVYKERVRYSAFVNKAPSQQPS